MVKNNLYCQCNDRRFTGSSCDEPLCSGHGIEIDVTTGSGWITSTWTECKCDAGWSGGDCEEKAL